MSVQNTFPEGSIESYLLRYEPGAAVSKTRHEKTQFNVRRCIADFISQHASGPNTLEIGAFTGWHTLAYRDRLKNPGRTVIYDWQDFRTPLVKLETEFNVVDLEKDNFPDSTGTFDVVVCNQVFEHLKNVSRPMSEIARVLKPGGIFIWSVPNANALHNAFLFALGRQPTTLRIMGSHVRCFSIWSASKFATFNGHFRILDLNGYGLHPLTSVRIPGPLKTWSHTPVWCFQRTESKLPDWQAVRNQGFSTTNY